MTLVNPDEDGRIFITRPEANGDAVQLKYQLLNPSSHFKEVVDHARAIVLAGGTMSPVSCLLVVGRFKRTQHYMVSEYLLDLRFSSAAVFLPADGATLHVLLVGQFGSPV